VTTSRQRVLDAIAHRQPDRVPVDFSGHRSSGIMAIAYRHLRAALGLPPRVPRVYDLIQQLAIVDEDVLARFGVDTIELGRGFCADDKWWREWRLPDGSACLIPAWADVRLDGGDWYLYNARGQRCGVQRAGSLYFEQLYYPLADGVPEDLAALPELLPQTMWAFPSPLGPAAPTPADLAAGARTLRASTDRAIIGLFGGNLLEWLQFLLRNDNCLMLLASEPATAHRLLDTLVEVHLANLERFLGAVGPYIDVILFGDDLGMQHGPQLSPAMYREFFQPRHRLLWQRAKQLAPVKVNLHSCGAIAPLLDDLIAAGMDAVNPVQTSATGMGAAHLKATYGARLCLWGGGCDTQVVLPKQTPAEVRDHVLRNLAILAPGGGFVFQQVHNIMADVPPANVIAMFDAVAHFNTIR